MDLIVKFLFLSGKYITCAAGKTILEIINHSVKIKRHVARKYEHLTQMVGPYDNMLELMNARIEDNGAANLAGSEMPALRLINYDVALDETAYGESIVPNNLRKENEYEQIFQDFYEDLCKSSTEIKHEMSQFEKNVPTSFIQRTAGLQPQYTKQHFYGTSTKDYFLDNKRDCKSLIPLSDRYAYMNSLVTESPDDSYFKKNTFPIQAEKPVNVHSSAEIYNFKTSLLVDDDPMDLTNENIVADLTREIHSRTHCSNSSKFGKKLTNCFSCTTFNKNSIKSSTSRICCRRFSSWHTLGSRNLERKLQKKICRIISRNLSSTSVGSSGEKDLDGQNRLYADLLKVNEVAFNKLEQKVTQVLIQQNLKDIQDALKTRFPGRMHFDEICSNTSTRIQNAVIKALWEKKRSQGLGDAIVLLENQIKPAIFDLKDPETLSVRKISSQTNISNLKCESNGNVKDNLTDSDKEDIQQRTDILESNWRAFKIFEEYLHNVMIFDKSKEPKTLIKDKSTEVERKASNLFSSFSIEAIYNSLFNRNSNSKCDESKLVAIKDDIALETKIEETPKSFMDILTEHENKLNNTPSVIPDEESLNLMIASIKPNEPSTISKSIESDFIISPITKSKIVSDFRVSSADRFFEQNYPKIKDVDQNESLNKKKYHFDPDMDEDEEEYFNPNTHYKGECIHNEIDLSETNEVIESLNQELYNQEDAVEPSVADLVTRLMDKPTDHLTLEPMDTNVLVFDSYLDEMDADDECQNYYEKVPKRIEKVPNQKLLNIEKELKEIKTHLKSLSTTAIVPKRDFDVIDDGKIAEYVLSKPKIDSRSDTNIAVRTGQQKKILLNIYLPKHGAGSKLPISSTKKPTALIHPTKNIQIVQQTDVKQISNFANPSPECCGGCAKSISIDPDRVIKLQKSLQFKPVDVDRLHKITEGLKPKQHFEYKLGTQIPKIDVDKLLKVQKHLKAPGVQRINRIDANQLMNLRENLRPATAPPKFKFISMHDQRKEKRKNDFVSTIKVLDEIDYELDFEDAATIEEESAKLAIVQAKSRKSFREQPQERIKESNQQVQGELNVEQFKCEEIQQEQLKLDMKKQNLNKRDQDDVDLNETKIKLKEIDHEEDVDKKQYLFQQDQFGENIFRENHGQNYTKENRRPNLIGPDPIKRHQVIEEVPTAKEYRLTNLSKYKINRPDLKKEDIIKEKLKIELMTEEEERKEQLKQEEMKREQLKQEELKKEQLKEEELKIQQLKEEELKEEELRQEQLLEEAIKQEQFKLEQEEELREEEMKVQKLEEEEEKQEELKREELRLEQLKQGQLKQQQSQQEKVKQQQMRQNQIKQQQMDQEQMKQKQIKQQQIQQEQLKQKQIKQQQTYQEQLRQNQIKQQQMQQEQFKQRQLKQEKLQKEQIKQEGIKQEQIKREQMRQEQFKQEKMRQDQQVRQERMRQEQIKQGQMTPEQIKREQIKQEQMKQEQMKQERMKQEQFKQEQIKQKQIKQEQMKQDQIKQEQMKQEQLKKDQMKQKQMTQDQIKQNQMKQDQIKQDQMKQDQMRQEQMRREQMRREQMRQEQGKQEQLRQQQLRQEQLRQEQMRQEKIRQEQIKQEKIKQENRKQEQIKQESKLEQLRQEQRQREQMRQEQLKQEQLILEKLREEERNKELLRQEQMKKEQLKKEQKTQNQRRPELVRQDHRSRQEQLKQEQLKQEQRKQEQMRQEQIRLEQYKQEQRRQELNRLEQLRLEQARQEQRRQEQIRQEQLQREQLMQEQMRQHQGKQEEVKQRQGQKKHQQYRLDQNKHENELRLDQERQNKSRKEQVQNRYNPNWPDFRFDRSAQDGTRSKIENCKLKQFAKEEISKEFKQDDLNLEPFKQEPFKEIKLKQLSRDPQDDFHDTKRCSSGEKFSAISPDKIKIRCSTLNWDITPRDKSNVLAVSFESNLGGQQINIQNELEKMNNPSRPHTESITRSTRDLQVSDITPIKSNLSTTITTSDDECKAAFENLYSDFKVSELSDDKGINLNVDEKASEMSEFQVKTDYKQSRQEDNHKKAQLQQSVNELQKLDNQKVETSKLGETFKFDETLMLDKTLKLEETSKLDKTLKLDETLKINETMKLNEPKLGESIEISNETIKSNETKNIAKTPEINSQEVAKTSDVINVNYNEFKEIAHVQFKEASKPNQFFEKLFGNSNSLLSKITNFKQKPDLDEPDIKVPETSMNLDSGKDTKVEAKDAAEEAQRLSKGVQLACVNKFKIGNKTPAKIEDKAKIETNMVNTKSEVTTTKLKNIFPFVPNVSNYGEEVNLVLGGVKDDLGEKTTVSFAIDKKNEAQNLQSRGFDGKKDIVDKDIDYIIDKNSENSAGNRRKFIRQDYDEDEDDDKDDEPVQKLQANDKQCERKLVEVLIPKKALVVSDSLKDAMVENQTAKGKEVNEVKIEDQKPKNEKMEEQKLENQNIKEHKLEHLKLETQTNQNLNDQKECQEQRIEEQRRFEGFARVEPLKRQDDQVKDATALSPRYRNASDFRRQNDYPPGLPPGSSGNNNGKGKADFSIENFLELKENKTLNQEMSSTKPNWETLEKGANEPPIISFGKMCPVFQFKPVKSDLKFEESEDLLIEELKRAQNKEKEAAMAAKEEENVRVDINPLGSCKLLIRDDVEIGKSHQLEEQFLELEAKLLGRLDGRKTEKHCEASLDVIHAKTEDKEKPRSKREEESINLDELSEFQKKASTKPTELFLRRPRSKSTVEKAPLFTQGVQECEDKESDDKQKMDNLEKGRNEEKQKIQTKQIQEIKQKQEMQQKRKELQQRKEMVQRKERFANDLQKLDLQKYEVPKFDLQDRQEVQQKQQKRQIHQRQQLLPNHQMQQTLEEKQMQQQNHERQFMEQRHIELKQGEQKQIEQRQMEQRQIAQRLLEQKQLEQRQMEQMQLEQRQNDQKQIDQRQIDQKQIDQRQIEQKQQMEQRKLLPVIQQRQHVELRPQRSPTRQRHQSQSPEMQQRPQSRQAEQWQQTPSVQQNQTVIPRQMPQKQMEWQQVQQVEQQVQKMPKGNQMGLIHKTPQVPHMAQVQNVSQNMGQPHKVSHVQNLGQVQNMGHVQHIAQTQNMGQMQNMGPVNKVSQLQNIFPAKKITRGSNMPQIQNIAQIPNLSPVQNVSQNITQAQNVPQVQNIPQTHNISQAQNIPQPQNMSQVQNISHSMSQPQNIQLIPQVQQSAQVQQIQQGQQMPHMQFSQAQIQKTNQMPKIQMPQPQQMKQSTQIQMQPGYQKAPQIQHLPIQSKQMQNQIQHNPYVSQPIQTQVQQKLQQKELQQNVFDVLQRSSFKVKENLYKSLNQRKSEERFRISDFKQDSDDKAHMNVLQKVSLPNKQRLQTAQIHQQLETRVLDSNDEEKPVDKTIKCDINLDIAKDQLQIQPQLPSFKSIPFRIGMSSDKKETKIVVKEIESLTEMINKEKPPKPTLIRSFEFKPLRDTQTYYKYDSLAAMEPRPKTTGNIVKSYEYNYMESLGTQEKLKEKKEMDSLEVKKIEEKKKTELKKAVEGTKKVVEETKKAVEEVKKVIEESKNEERKIEENVEEKEKEEEMKDIFNNFDYQPPKEKSVAERRPVKVIQLRDIDLSSPTEEESKLKRVDNKLAEESKEVETHEVEDKETTEQIDKEKQLLMEAERERQLKSAANISKHFAKRSNQQQEQKKIFMELQNLKAQEKKMETEENFNRYTRSKSTVNFKDKKKEKEMRSESETQIAKRKETRNENLLLKVKESKIIEDVLREKRLKEKGLKDKFSSDKILDNLSNDLSKDKLSKDKFSNDKLLKDKLSKGKLSKDDLPKDKVSSETNLLKEIKAFNERKALKELKALNETNGFNEIKTMIKPTPIKEFEVDENQTLEMKASKPLKFSMNAKFPDYIDTEEDLMLMPKKPEVKEEVKEEYNPFKLDRAALYYKNHPQYLKTMKETKESQSEEKKRNKRNYNVNDDKVQKVESSSMCSKSEESKQFKRVNNFFTKKYNPVDYALSMADTIKWKEMQAKARANLDKAKNDKKHSRPYSKSPDRNKADLGSVWPKVKIEERSAIERAEKHKFYMSPPTLEMSTSAVLDTSHKLKLKPDNQEENTVVYSFDDRYRKTTNDKEIQQKKKDYWKTLKREDTWSPVPTELTITNELYGSKVLMKRQQPRKPITYDDSDYASRDLVKEERQMKRMRQVLELEQRVAERRMKQKQAEEEEDRKKFGNISPLLKYYLKQKSEKMVKFDTVKASDYPNLYKEKKSEEIHQDFTPRMRDDKKSVIINVPTEVNIFDKYPLLRKKKRVNREKADEEMQAEQEAEYREMRRVKQQKQEAERLSAQAALMAEERSNAIDRKTSYANQTAVKFKNEPYANKVSNMMKWKIRYNAHIEKLNINAKKHEDNKLVKKFPFLKKYKKNLTVTDWAEQTSPIWSKYAKPYNPATAAMKTIEPFDANKPLTPTNIVKPQTSNRKYVFKEKELKTKLGKTIKVTYLVQEDNEDEEQ